MSSELRTGAIAGEIGKLCDGFSGLLVDLSSSNDLSRSPSDNEFSPSPTGSRTKTSTSKQEQRSRGSPKVKSKFYISRSSTSSSIDSEVFDKTNSQTIRSPTASSPLPSPKSNRRRKSAQDEQRLELSQTHVGTFDFYPRHKDELTVKQGDPLHIVESHDDLWLDGFNLTTGKRGILPARYAADILSTDRKSDISTIAGVDEYYLRFLGSVEVADFKGDDVLCFAIAKVVNQHSSLSNATPYPCTLQITRHGIKVIPIDKPNQPPPNKKFGKNKKQNKTTSQEVNAVNQGSSFAMKNVTFCGNHPRDRRYFGFITRHPSGCRYACHVFVSKFSTDPVAESFGVCFKQFHEDYLERRNPIEDIYIE